MPHHNLTRKAHPEVGLVACAFGRCPAAVSQPHCPVGAAGCREKLGVPNTEVSHNGNVYDGAVDQAFDYT